MMSEFMGMAIYTKEDIGCALKNYKTNHAKAEYILKDAVTRAELNYKPTWMDRVLYRATDLYKKYQSADQYDNYEFWLQSKGLLKFSEVDSKFIGIFIHSYFFHLDLSNCGNEYNQIRNLYNGGKDCYLNPRQASFVNRFKVMGGE